MKREQLNSIAGKLVGDYDWIDKRQLFNFITFAFRCMDNSSCYVLHTKKKVNTEIIV